MLIVIDVHTENIENDASFGLKTIMRFIGNRKWNWGEVSFVQQKRSASLSFSPTNGAFNEALLFSGANCSNILLLFFLYISLFILL